LRTFFFYTVLQDLSFRVRLLFEFLSFFRPTIPSNPSEGPPSRVRSICHQPSTFYKALARHPSFGFPASFAPLKCPFSVRSDLFLSREEFSHLGHFLQSSQSPPSAYLDRRLFAYPLKVFSTEVSFPSERTVYVRRTIDRPMPPAGRPLTLRNFRPA